MDKYCLLLYLFSILQVASSIEIQCSYNTNFNYSILGPVYRCEIQNNFDVASPEDVVVNSVNGKHLDNMNNNNVTGLFSASKNLKYIPKKMENFFKNIKLIDLVDNKIKEIQQDDLKSFPKLIYCGFKDNEIETLENGLFDFNLELQLVSFWNNKITQVGPNVFDHLTQLTWLYFDQNSCIDMRVEDNRSGVQKMIQKVTQNCKTSNEGTSCDTKKEIEELKFLFKNLTTDHENGLTAMTKTTKDLAEKNEKFEKDLNEALERIKVLESKFNNIDVESQNMKVKPDANRNTISKNMEVKADVNRNTIFQNMEVKTDANKNANSQQPTVYCGFKDNDIEILEDELFDYNPEIQLISFWSNKILYVGIHLFNGLTKLSAIYFDENQCIKMRIDANVTAVQDMIKQIKRKCAYDPKQQIDKLQYSFDDLKKNGLTSINGKTAELEAKNHKLANELYAFMEKIKDLESKLSYLESKISRLFENLENCSCSNDL